MHYENHILEDKLLPFIFHYDTINITGGEEFNAFGNWHENPEFLYFVKGRGHVIYNDQHYSVCRGDMVVINSDCFHAVSSQKNLEYYCLIVDTDFFRSNGIPIDSLNYRQLIKNSDYIDFFEKLVFLYKDKTKNCAKIRAAILNFLIDIGDKHIETNVISDKFPECIKDSITFIKKHYSEELTIDDIVNYIGFSRAYFSRMFKKHTGVSIITYLNYIRCRQARVMLIKNELTVGQIAESCGFNNLSYFSKTYKSIMGILPSEELKKNSKSDSKLSVTSIQKHSPELKFYSF